MGSGYSKMKKQAKLMQQKYSQMQEELQAVEATGEAPNGLVKITINGDKEIKSITINPECVDPNDVEGLQDLIIIAYKDAAQKVEKQSPMGNLPF